MSLEDRLALYELYLQGRKEASFGEDYLEKEALNIRGAAASAASKLREGAGYVGRKAREGAGYVGRSRPVSYVGGKLDRPVSYVGRQTLRGAEAVRSRASRAYRKVRRGPSSAQTYVSGTGKRRNINIDDPKLQRIVGSAVLGTGALAAGYGGYRLATGRKKQASLWDYVG